MQEPRPRGPPRVVLLGAGLEVFRLLPHQAALQDQAHPNLDGDGIFATAARCFVIV